MRCVKTRLAPVVVGPSSVRFKGFNLMYLQMETPRTQTQAIREALAVV